MFVSKLTSACLKVAKNGVTQYAKYIVATHKGYYKILNAIIKPEVAAEYYRSLANNPNQSKFIRNIARADVKLCELLAGTAK